MSDSLQAHGLQPTRLLCLWNFPGKNTGVSCLFLLQDIFPTQGLNPRLPHWQADFFYNWATREALNTSYFTPNLSYKSSEQFWITTWPFGSMLKTVDLHLVKIHAKLLFGVNLIKIYKLRRPSGSWLSLGKWRRISFPSYNGDKSVYFLSCWLNFKGKG